MNKMFNVGDYVYANIQLELNMNIEKNTKPVIHHGIIIDIIQFEESHDVFYEILDQHGELNSFAEINVFDSIDKIRK